MHAFAARRTLFEGFMRLVVLTHSASPYQVELFNAAATISDVDLHVVYLQESDRTRNWSRQRFAHDAQCLDQCRGHYENVVKRIKDAELVVVNYYADGAARRLIKARCATGNPWCFWGERPGVGKPEWLGRIRRRILLSELYHSKVPIWGIGRFAVQGYKAEFGDSRRYADIPYYSELHRFQRCSDDRNVRTHDRVFLFSGSLIYRKGVDLVARAFLRLSGETNIRLKVLGAGELRAKLVRLLQPVQDRVEFLGFADWQELPSYYAAGDILCVPSRYDGWGLVVPEGLAAGMPVIGTTRMGAAIELIERDRNGWLIEADDEKALFEAMRAAALLPIEEFYLMSARARASVAEHTLQVGAARFIRAANEVVANWT